MINIININNPDPEDLYVAKHYIENGARQSLDKFLKSLKLSTHIYCDNRHDIQIAFSYWTNLINYDDDQSFLFVTMDGETDCNPCQNKFNQDALQKIIDWTNNVIRDNYHPISNVELTEKAFYDSKYYQDYFMVDDKIYVTEY